jgi:hypothetical protein
MTGSVGPRGLTLLLVVGAVGLALAVIGWVQRGSAKPADGSGPVAVHVTAAGQRLAAGPGL